MKYEFYKLEPKTLAGIKDGNVEAINRFYEDNFGLFRGMSGKFVRNRRLENIYRYEVDDLMQQLYVDIPHFDYTDERTLTCSIFRSFKYSDNGGILHRAASARLKNISIDSPIFYKGEAMDGAALLDCIVSSAAPDEIIFESEEREKSAQRFEKIIEVLFGTGEAARRAEVYFNTGSYKEAKEICA